MEPELAAHEPKPVNQKSSSSPIIFVTASSKQELAILEPWASLVLVWHETHSHTM